MAGFDRLASVLKRAKQAGDALSNDLAQIRAQRIEKVLERDRIEKAPVDRTTMEQRARLVLERASVNFASKWTDVDLASPELSDRARRFKADVMSEDPFGAYVYLFGGDDIADRLVERAIAALPEGAELVTSAQREKALAKINAEIREIEVIEEKAIRAAADAGIRVPRRDDANPEIFLDADI